MSMDLNSLLRGTVDNIKEARARIASNFKRYEKYPPSDVKINQMKYSLHVARDLCAALNASDAQHFKLYCDILLDVVGPYVSPEVNLMQWTKFLEFIRYFHYLLVDKACLNQAVRVFDYLVKQPQKLYSQKDYKYVLGTYCQHLLVQRTIKCTDVKMYKIESNRALDALFELLVDMVYRKKSLNFVYPDFTDDFVQALLPKCNKNHLNFIASLPEDRQSKIFKVFFDLISSTDIPEEMLNRVDATVYLRQHLRALAAFLLIDSQQRSKLRLAVLHLQSCREIPVLRNDKLIRFVICLLLKYVDLLYMETVDCNFRARFNDVCISFMKFLDKSTRSLMDTKWFYDYLLIINIIHSLMRQSPKDEKCLEIFWSQMRSIELFQSHIEVMATCIKLIPDKIESNFTFWLCCKDLKNHMIVSFMESAINSLSIMFTNQVKLQTNCKQLTEFTKHMDYIMKEGVAAVQRLSCLTSEAYDLKMLYARFAQLTRDCRTPKHVQIVLPLAQYLTSIKEKFSRADWTLMLRRIYKTVEILHDAPLVNEMQMCYITSMLKESSWPDMIQLRNQIALFHMTKTQDKSIVIKDISLCESYQTSTSVFKPELSKEELRILYWLEVNYFIKYHTKNDEFRKSLLRCCFTHYDYVMVARSGKMLNGIECTLLNVVTELRCKKRKIGDLNRHDTLVMAHGCTMLLMHKLEESKSKLTLDIKMCAEDNLEELLKFPGISQLSVFNEITIVNSALEAFHLFETFYNKFDEEYLPSSEIQIDWDALLEDLQSLSNFFHLSGYIEYALKVWTLLYRIGSLIMNPLCVIRVMGSMSEYITYMDKHEQLYWSQKIFKRTIGIKSVINEIGLLSRRQQVQILHSFCYLAQHFDQFKEAGLSHTLFNMVQEEHIKLADRSDKYDVVRATINAVQLRNIWNHLAAEGARVSTLLMREIEIALGRLRDIYIATNETQPYMMLLFNFIQDISECSAQRLYDKLVSSFMPAILKMAFQTCSAQRVVQVLTMWILTDLQMELIDKAMIKLKIIELILGTKNLKELVIEGGKSNQLKPARKLKRADTEDGLISPRRSPNLGVVRRTAPKMYEIPFTLELKPYLRNQDLDNYLTMDNLGDMRELEVLQWGCFVTGCLHARIFYLCEDFDQLAQFYKKADQWFKIRKINFCAQKYQYFKLMTNQHHINYLRACGNYNMAMKVAKNAIENCNNMNNFNKVIDVSFRINFLLQLNAIKIERKNVSESEKLNYIRLASDEVTPEKNAIMKRMIEGAQRKLMTTMSSCKNPWDLLNDFDDIKALIEAGNYGPQLPLSISQWIVENRFKKLSKLPITSLNDRISYAMTKNSNGSADSSPFVQNNKDSLKSKKSESVTSESPTKKSIRSSPLLKPTPEQIIELLSSSSDSDSSKGKQNRYEGHRTRFHMRVAERKAKESRDNKENHDSVNFKELIEEMKSLRVNDNSKLGSRRVTAQKSTDKPYSNYEKIINGNMNGTNVACSPASNENLSAKRRGRPPKIVEVCASDDEKVQPVGTKKNTPKKTTKTTSRRRRNF